MLDLPGVSYLQPTPLAAPPRLQAVQIAEPSCYSQQKWFTRPRMPVVRALRTGRR